jgi:TetR/AcrR family transcriptional regulator, mexJK operon transcriptional repressor
MLAVALSPEALALSRILLAEAPQFPELAQVIAASGARKGVEHIAELLQREAKAGRLSLKDPHFAAAQFQTMVLTIPTRRAQGLDRPLGPKELDHWAWQTVDLFLNGCQQTAGA